MTVTSLLFTFVGLSAIQTKPTPPPELAHLDPMIGEWAGEMAIGPKLEFKGPVVLKFERILDGLYVSVDLTHEIPGMGVIRGHTVLAWDASAKRIRAYAFANGGMADPAKPREEQGTLARGDLSLDSVGSLPTYRQKLTVQTDGSLVVRFTMQLKPDQPATEIGFGRLKRQKVGERVLATPKGDPQKAGGRSLDAPEPFEPRSPSHR